MKTLSVRNNKLKLISDLSKNTQLNHVDFSQNPLFSDEQLKLEALKKTIVTKTPKKIDPILDGNKLEKPPALIYNPQVVRLTLGDNPLKFLPILQRSLRILTLTQLEGYENDFPEMLQTLRIAYPDIHICEAGPHDDT